PVVLIVAADVEGLPAHHVAWGGQDGDEGSRDVLDVDDRPPGRAVALEEDLAGGEGPGDEVVEHDVEAETGGDPVGGGAPQESRAEGAVGQPGHVALCTHLRLAVRGDRVEVRVFVDGRVAGRAVVAARRGEHEAAHSRLAGEAGQANGR